MDRQNTLPLFSDDYFNELLLNNSLEIGEFPCLQNESTFDANKTEEEHRRIIRKNCSVNNLLNTPTGSILAAVKAEHVALAPMSESNDMGTPSCSISSTPPEVLHAVPYTAVHSSNVMQVQRAGMVQCKQVEVVHQNTNGVQLTQQQYQQYLLQLQQQQQAQVQQQQQEDECNERVWSPGILAVTGIVAAMSDDNDVLNREATVDQFHLSEFTAEVDRKPASIEEKKYVPAIPTVPSLGAPPPLHRSDTTDMSTLTDWKGDYSFSVTVPSEHKFKNKYCYSPKRHMLFCYPHFTMELHLHVKDWTRVTSSTSVRVCAVYSDPSNRTEPVNRCPQCFKKADRCPLAHHVVQMGNSGAVHGMMGSRYMAAMKLAPPRLGQDYVTLLVKVTCLTSCPGGPNRRAFVLVFSILDGDVEKGRCVLPIKCCKVPGRDSNNNKKETGLARPKINGQEDCFNDSNQIMPGPSDGKRKTKVPKQEIPSLLVSSDSETDRNSCKKQRSTSFRQTRFNLITKPDESQIPPGFCFILAPVELRERAAMYIRSETIMAEVDGKRLASGNASEVCKVLEAANK